MQESHALEPFKVDVFCESRMGKQEAPWVEVGVFDRLEDAVEACKEVVDNYLRSPINLFISPDMLVTDFLSYGHVPVIRGVENLPIFDVYDYLANRCKQVSSLQESI